MGLLLLDRYHFYFLVILKGTLTLLSLSNSVLQQPSNTGDNIVTWRTLCHGMKWIISLWNDIKKLRHIGSQSCTIYQLSILVQLRKGIMISSTGTRWRPLTRASEMDEIVSSFFLMETLITVPVKSHSLLTLVWRKCQISTSCDAMQSYGSQASLERLQARHESEKSTNQMKQPILLWNFLSTPHFPHEPLWTSTLGLTSYFASCLWLEGP